MAKKIYKKRRQSRIRAICFLLLPAFACAGIFGAKIAVELVPAMVLQFGGGDKESDGKETRTTQTSESKKGEEALFAYITVKNLDIQEDAYGFLELSAQAEMPDFSAHFADNIDAAEADAEDAYEFEALLFSKTAETLTETEASITRDITVDLTAEDGTKAKDDWTEAELADLVKQSAFEAELEETALEIMGDCLSATTNWEADAAETDEKAEITEDGTESSGVGEGETQ